LSAEFEAQYNNLGIWNPDTNDGGNKRDYGQLIPWWHLRASVVEGYRKFGIQAGVKSVRLDYDEIVEAAKTNSVLTVFCDLQNGINRWVDDNALIYAGSVYHKFNLWIPNIYRKEAQEILNIIQKRYAKYGKGYLYVKGKASMYKDKPQIVLTDIELISDNPF